VQGEKMKDSLEDAGDSARFQAHQAAASTDYAVRDASMHAAAAPSDADAAVHGRTFTEKVKDVTVAAMDKVQEGAQYVKEKLTG